MDGRPDENHPPSVRNASTSEAGLTDMIHRDHAQGRPLAGTIQARETAIEEEGTGTWQIEQGTDVLCEDGEKVGEVVDVMPGYLVVEQGFLDPTDIYVPLDLIDGHDETSISLSMTREAFDSEDWSEEPAGDAPGAEDAPPA
jgi:hypothetical protein